VPFRGVGVDRFGSGEQGPWLAPAANEEAGIDWEHEGSAVRGEVAPELCSCIGLKCQPLALATGISPACLFGVLALACWCWVSKARG